MKSFPIIPIWLMLLICLGLITYIIIFNKKNIIQIIIVVLLFIINFRFMIPTNKVKTEINNFDILFVVDNTISMQANDYGNNKTRLDAVKSDIKYIIDHYEGARFSVISFSNDAKILIPYTTDSNLAFETIDILKPPNEFYARGSSLNTPIDTIIESLNISHKKEDRIRIIFFISDGEITDDSELESYSKIASLIDNGAVLGYGTKKGGYMIIENSYTGKKEYIETYENYKRVKAISKIDENNLIQIAKDLKVEYVYMDKQKNIDKILNKIDKSIKKKNALIDKSSYDDIYFIFVIPLFILLTINYCKFRRNEIWKKY